MIVHKYVLAAIRLYLHMTDNWSNDQLQDEK